MIFLALYVAVVPLIDLLDRGCKINVRFTCHVRHFSPAPEFIRDGNNCRPDSLGRGRSARTSYLDYGAPHQQRSVLSVF